MKYIFRYHYYNLKRFNISTSKLLPPEYLGLFFVIALFSTIFFGVSSENCLNYEGYNFIDFNKLAFFYFVAPIFIEAFMYKHYDPNYVYLKVTLPFSNYKIIFIDFLVEFFSFKFFFLFLFPFLYIIFSLNYNLKLFNYNFFIYGFFLILLMYTNSCLFINLLKSVIRNSKLDIYKNYVKFFILILIVLFILNENYLWIQLEIASTIFLLIKIFVVVFFLQIILLLSINKIIDKC